MRGIRLMILLLAAIVSTSLLLGGAVHSFVPHDHGDSHGSNLVWQSLHASIRHEEEHAYNSAWMIFFTIPFALVIARALLPRFVSPPITAFEIVLHRGISKHRRFG